MAPLLEARRAVGPQVRAVVGHLLVRPGVGLTLLQGAAETVVRHLFLKEKEWPVGEDAQTLGHKLPPFAQIIKEQ